MAKKKIEVTGKVVKNKVTVNKKPSRNTPTSSQEELKTAKTVCETITASKVNRPSTEISTTKPKVKAVKKPIKEINDGVLERSGDEVPIINRVGPQKDKRFKEDKYYRIKSTDTQENFASVGNRVRNGELRWAFFTIIADVGYHYYLDLSKIKK